MKSNNKLLATVAKMSPAEYDDFMSLVTEYKIAQQQIVTTPQAETFTDFKKRFWKGYQHARHQQAIDDKLSKVAEYVLSGGKSGIGRLMIFMPPRHGKTESVSRMFPAYLLGLRPELKIILTSYGATLAEKNSNRVRRLLNRPEYRAAYPDTVYEAGTRKNWQTSAEGGIVAAGVGGAITGEGGYLLICDDLTKGRAEAESPTKRQTLKEWYQADLSSRLEEPGGAIIVMQTRYHTDDLPGYLLSSEDEDSDLETADNWVVLNLPAIAEEDDPIGRDPGEALWPEKYPITVLNKRRAKMGEYDFSALYQQRPIPKAAGLFDTALIKVVDSVPDLVKVVRFWDLAVSARTTADYSVGLKLGRAANGDLYVLDVYRRQAAPAATGEAIVTTALRDGIAVPIKLEAENSARVQLDYLLRDPRLALYTLELLSPDGDKYTRAAPVAARANAGQLHIVRAAWNRVFLDELALFPLVKNDDQTDALSGAYRVIGGNSFSGMTTSRATGLYPTKRKFYDVPGRGEPAD